MSLTSFPPATGKNPVGWVRVFIAAKSDVKTIPPATSGDVSSAITMETGKVFIDFPFDDEAGSFCSMEQPEAEGTTGYKYNFTMFYAANTAAAKAALDALDGVYCIIIGQRSDGSKEILGDTDRGIRLYIAREEAKGSRAGYPLTGSVIMDHLLYTYSNGTIPT